MTDKGQELTDQLVAGASDYIITKDILARGGSGDWDEDAVKVARWVALGTLAYLVNLSQRGGFEDELNVFLNRLVGEMDGG
jgi:hypothetical protein